MFTREVSIVKVAAFVPRGQDGQRYRMRRSADVVAGDELAAGVQVSSGVGHARLVGPVAGDGLLREGGALFDLAHRVLVEEVDAGDA